MKNTDTCPNCTVETDARTNAYNDEEPEPGDISICFYCAAVNVLDEDLQSRRPTPEEALELAQDEMVLNAQRAVLRSLAARGEVS